jgi:hypothetical protein
MAVTGLAMMFAEWRPPLVGWIEALLVLDIDIFASKVSPAVCSLPTALEDNYIFVCEAPRRCVLPVKTHRR